MNVVFIPSWYPTDDHPITGIFVRDQALAVSKHGKNVKVCVSLWGSHEEKLLLSARKLRSSISNLTQTNRLQPYKRTIAPNCFEYFHPAFTWSRHFRAGNIEKIIQANLNNIRAFETEFGPMDIIHAHIGHPGGYIASTISEQLNVPYIVTEQMSPFPSPIYLSKKNELDRWLRRGYDHSKRNISVGNDQLNTMTSFGVDRQKFIPNLVDESFFTVKKEGVKDQPFSFFSLGRLEEQKGFDILLKAFQKVLLKFPKTHLTIGGNGSERQQLYKLASDLNIKSNVTWLGETDRTQSLDAFQNCHAFVLASRHESFGIVLAEALACGKPIVTTLCGGPKDIYSPAVGLAAEPDNVDDLAKQMSLMIADSSAYNQADIRHYFDQKFSSKIIAQEIQAVYQEVIDSQ